MSLEYTLSIIALVVSLVNAGILAFAFWKLDD